MKFSDDIKAWPVNGKKVPFVALTFTDSTGLTITSNGTGTLDGSGNKWWGLPGIGCEHYTAFCTPVDTPYHPEPADRPQIPEDCAPSPSVQSPALSSPLYACLTLAVTLPHETSKETGPLTLAVTPPHKMSNRTGPLGHVESVT